MLFLGLLEKVYDKIYAKGRDLTGIKKKLFFWAIALGEEWNHTEKMVLGTNLN